MNWNISSFVYHNLNILLSHIFWDKMEPDESHSDSEFYYPSNIISTAENTGNNKLNVVFF